MATDSSEARDSDHTEFWRQGSAFLPPRRVLPEEDLFAIGGDLSVPRLLAAYRQGVFPWYDETSPMPLWWNPDPRMVLFPEEFRLSRSLAKTLRRGAYEVRVDSAFPEVIAACAAISRDGQRGTWITPDMTAAYTALHHAGYAHSVETWIAGELAGGLYGVAIGRMFYGESMFASCRDASKIALAHLVAYLRNEGFGLIDCQMSTAHLASLGGREIGRGEFLALLARLAGQEETHWPSRLVWAEECRREAG
ncbi:MAG: leucyl/phenylalanyl-tRNA--protein transferase [Zoogloeaceae bacterium]|jgi:leucyl/phenylalanyl-tRNA--protein transferase|nr:leucyl/phenylalanyl-tRNA--protein transferase [Zoogloeaceae bacterium]